MAKELNMNIEQYFDVKEESFSNDSWEMSNAMDSTNSNASTSQYRVSETICFQTGIKIRICCLRD